MKGEYTETVTQIKNQLLKLERLIKESKVNLVVYDAKCDRSWGTIETNFVPRKGDYITDDNGYVRKVRQVIWDFKKNRVHLNVK